MQRLIKNASLTAFTQQIATVFSNLLTGPELLDVVGGAHPRIS
jgi:hypothetical protein